MSKYILQLRKGIKYVDQNGATLLNPNGTPVRDDWTTYTAQENHLDPLEAELVLEYEINPDTGKKTPRLKIGDGLHSFADLEYISVDSFILPTPASVTVYANKWQPVKDENGVDVPNRYYQEVIVQNATITPNSKVDLQITPEDLVTFHEKDVSFTTVNDDGNVRVCIIGKQPANNYTLRANVTEVTING